MIYLLDNSASDKGNISIPKFYKYFAKGDHQRISESFASSTLAMFHKGMYVHEFVLRAIDDLDRECRVYKKFAVKKKYTRDKDFMSKFDDLVPHRNSFDIYRKQDAARADSGKVKIKKAQHLIDLNSHTEKAKCNKHKLEIWVETREVFLDQRSAELISRKYDQFNALVTMLSDQIGGKDKIAIERILKAANVPPGESCVYDIFKNTFVKSLLINVSRGFYRLDIDPMRSQIHRSRR